MNPSKLAVGEMDSDRLGVLTEVFRLTLEVRTIRVRRTGTGQWLLNDLSPTGQDGHL